MDTEGSGLFDFTQPADAPGQPRLAQLHMILLNEDLSIAEEYGALIRPDGWEMTPEATAINGLTTDLLQVGGLPIREVMDVYSQAIKEGYVIVAFNAQFDLKACRAEMRRAGMPDLFEQTPNVCVMRMAKGVIPRPDGKTAWPKLDHCRQFLGRPSDGAHGAKGDAHDALAVLRYLIQQGVQLEPDVHYAKERPIPLTADTTPPEVAGAIGQELADRVSRPRGVVRAELDPIEIARQGMARRASEEIPE